MFAGLGMLDEGLVKSRRRLPWAEYGIIVLIFVAITAFGLLEGVGAGMLATLVFFVVRLSGVNPVEARFTLRERHSNKARPVPDRAILLEEGERVHAYRLRGYLFFGGVSPLAERLRQELHGPVRPLCLLLDFSAVSGFDFSAVNVLCRFMQTAHAAGVGVVLSATSEALRTGVEHNLSASVYAELPMEPNLDRALERCEEIVLAAWKEDEDRTHGRRAALLEHAAGDLDRYLERQIDFEYLTEQLQRWTSACRYDAGIALKGPGAPHDGLQLVISGRASGYDADGARMSQYRPGGVVWPSGSLHEKDASVVADETCRTMHLTPDARIRLEQRDPQLALMLYRYLFGARVSRE